MQFEDFKRWLAKRGATKNALATRAGAMRRVERVMGELGESEEDLNAARPLHEVGEYAV